ncbi:hypothetical protein EDD18DRAFT_1102011 [Armillaria luteobubalina]|uniref:Uncharacterized protein n=1 Tax=Armillaria luteobubalina TaxID=153913 RepID=A0AA39QFF2_9AGAR|nr:hypothetical protein EDD18DRAFT_1102011 [Armillaria luteobubalina]
MPFLLHFLDTDVAKGLRVKQHGLQDSRRGSTATDRIRQTVLASSLIMCKWETATANGGESRVCKRRRISDPEEIPNGLRQYTALHHASNDEEAKSPGLSERKKIGAVASISTKVLTYADRTQGPSRSTVALPQDRTLLSNTEHIINILPAKETNKKTHTNAMRRPPQLLLRLNLSVVPGSPSSSPWSSFTLTGTQTTSLGPTCSTDMMNLELDTKKKARSIGSNAESGGRVCLDQYHKNDTTDIDVILGKWMRMPDLFSIGGFPPELEIFNDPLEPWVSGTARSAYGHQTKI